MLRKIRNTVRKYGDIITLVLVGFILYQNANYLKTNFKKNFPKTSENITNMSNKKTEEKK